MPPLKNTKHEAFAQVHAAQLLDPTVKPSAAVAYAQVYGAQSVSAGANSSRLINMDGGRVVSRISEILSKLNPISDLSDDLKRLRHVEKVVFIDGKREMVPDNPVQLGALQTALKAHGAFADSEAINSQVNIQLTLDPVRLAALAVQLDTLNSRLISSGRSGIIDVSPAEA